jgi:hypothetical protein
MLYSYKNQYPQKLPDRIRLSNGLTRTGVDTFTPEEILDAGYVEVFDKSQCDINEVINWSGTEWIVYKLSEEQIAKNKEYEMLQKWIEIRKLRDETIKLFEWKFNRYNSQLRLGLTPTDDIDKLDTYIQALRDITKQEDPFNIVWPIYEFVVERAGFDK